MNPEKRTTTTTTIRVNGMTWDVPRGFGREYLRVAKLENEFQGAGLDDLLGLIGYTVSATTIAKWSFRERVELSVYAANVHARASDNAVPAHPRPTRLPDPWRGKATGKGVFAGPGATVIR